MSDEQRAHLIGDIANLGRAEIARVLRHTEKLWPGRLAQSVRERDHRAHIAAHALAALLLHTEASQTVWQDVGSALELVSTRAGELLRQHLDDAFTPRSLSDDHVAHCMTDAAMLKAHELEPSWFAETPPGRY